LTYKGLHIPEAQVSDLCVSQEFEGALTKEAYDSLKEKCQGIVVTKTRYKIPYGQYTIELDLFHGQYDGMVLAEVEFPSIEKAREFVAPEWFDKDVSDDYHYRNTYLALKNINN